MLLNDDLRADLESLREELHEDRKRLEAAQLALATARTEARALDHRTSPASIVRKRIASRLRRVTSPRSRHVGEPPAACPEGTSDVPTFRVLALGLPGVGKTVLLASQFHELSGPLARPYFLDGHLEEDQRLAPIYGEISDTSSATWPPATPTAEMHEFLFDCKAFNRVGDERTLFRISYLDYSGEILEPDNVAHKTRREFAAKARDAHALLVMVDGQRVLGLLRNERYAGDYFDQKLRPLLLLAEHASCPIQLIITKWDLVRSFADPGDDDACLREVRDRLMAYGNIEQLVRGHARRFEDVRLIPVSAVGPRFAELTAGGTIVKRPDGMLEPHNIDVPLSSVLPGMLKRVERSLEPPVPSIRYFRAPLIGGSRIFAWALHSWAGKRIRKAMAVVIGDTLMGLLVEALVRSSKADEAEARQEHQVETQRMRTAVITDMEEVVLRFTWRLPSSILRSRS